MNIGYNFWLNNCTCPRVGFHIVLNHYYTLLSILLNTSWRFTVSIWSNASLVPGRVAEPLSPLCQASSFPFQVLLPLFNQKCRECPISQNGLDAFHLPSWGRPSHRYVQSRQGQVGLSGWGKMHVAMTTSPAAGSEELGEVRGNGGPAFAFKC